MIPKIALTTKKVPSDSVIVVTMICGPDLFICFHIISVPIMMPKRHSSKLSALLNQSDPKRPSFNNPKACGPMMMPVMSQPKIAGSLSLDIRRPAMNAIVIAKARRMISLKIVKVSTS